MKFVVMCVMLLDGVASRLLYRGIGRTRESAAGQDLEICSALCWISALCVFSSVQFRSRNGFCVDNSLQSVDLTPAVSVRHLASVRIQRRAIPGIL